MTSQRINYGRRSQMLENTAKAPAILASETDHVEDSFWYSKAGFLRDHPYFGAGRPWKEDDQNIDLMALVVLDDFSAEVRRPDQVKPHMQNLKLMISRPSPRSSAPTQKRVTSLTFGWLTRTTPFQTGTPPIRQKALLARWTVIGAHHSSGPQWRKLRHSFKLLPSHRSRCVSGTLLSCVESITSKASSF